MPAEKSRENGSGDVLCEGVPESDGVGVPDIERVALGELDCEGELACDGVDVCVSDAEGEFDSDCVALCELL